MKSKHVMWVLVLAVGAMFTSCSKDPVANLTEEEFVYILQTMTPQLTFQPLDHSVYLTL